MSDAQKDHEHGRFRGLLLLLRGRAGVTQRQAAAAAGVSLRAVQAWEAGISYPGAASLQGLIALFVERKALTAGHEAEEAESLWDAALWEAPQLKAAFDRAWFSRVLAGTTGPTPRDSTTDGLPPAPEQAGRFGAARDLFATAPLDSLVGRDDDLAALVELFGRPEVRLVTLTGPAGVGKTRLALAVTERLGSVFPERVGIDLAPVREPGLVLSAIAARLGLQEREAPTAEDVAAFLAGRRTLLVLDNFEQVLPAADAVPALLAAAPGLRVLVTSRAPLELRAEHVYLVSPLRLPDVQHLPRPEDLIAVPAVRLFVDRARAAGGVEDLTTENAAAIAALCTHLDGLPLAIELAAARTPLLSPQMMLERLGQRLTLLAWDARDLPERQRTLRAALDWSYDLLSEQEQALFRSLGVFVGGFTLDAVEALACSARGGNANAVVLLAALVQTSLVVSESGDGGERRFRLLESIREYALAQLSARREEQSVRDAHAAYFVELVERAEAELRGAQQRTWYQRLERERQNLYAAMQWLAEQPISAREPAAERSDGRGAAAGPTGGERTQNYTVQLLRLAAGAGLFWLFHGDLGERRRWLQLALLRSQDAPARLRLKAEIALGQALSLGGEVDQARTVLSEALNLARTLNAVDGAAEAFVYRSWCNLHAGAWESALTDAEEGLAAAKLAGDDWLVALALYFIGVARRLQGEPQSALAPLEEAVLGFRAVGDTRLAAIALHNFGAASDEAGEHAQAVDCFKALLALSSELEDPWLLYLAGEWISVGMGAAGDAELLAELLGALDALQRARGLGHSLEQSRRDRLTRSLTSRLSAERYAAARERGRAHTIEQTTALIRRLLNSLPGTDANARARTLETVPGNDGVLSGREKAVLLLLAAGLSNKEIAARLSVAERTVRYHLTSLFNKLGVSSRTQALSAARKQRLI